MGRWGYRASDSGDKQKPVKHTWWYTAPLEDGWVVDVTFTFDDEGVLGMESVTIRTEDGSLRDVNSTVWKRLRLGEFRKAAQAAWPSFRIRLGSGPDLGEWPEQLIGQGPGRRGHPAAHYALWAERYEQALAVAPRTPVKLLAEQYHQDEQTIRAWLAKAEELGFFTRPNRNEGRAGGRLTAKGRALLEKERACGDD